MIEKATFKYGNVTKGACEFFNNSSISSNVEGIYIKSEIFEAIDPILTCNNIYKKFWNSISTTLKEKNRFNKKNMIEFVKLCETTYKQYKIEMRKNALIADFKRNI